MANFAIKYWDDTPILRLGTGAEVIGTPIVAVEFTYDGSLVPAYLDLTFSSVDPGVDATMTIAAPSTNYGIHGMVLTEVPLDESWYYGIPGLRIKLNNDVGFLSAWKDRIYAGAYFGNHKAGNPDGLTIDESDGPTFTADTGQGAGAKAHTARWKIENTSTKTAFECFAKISNVVLLDRLTATGDALSYAFTGTTESVEKFDGADGGTVDPYVITFESKNTVPSPDTITMKVDGAIVASGVLNTSTGALTSSANLSVGVLYRFTTGPLTDVEFTIALTVTNADTINLWVFSPRWTEITPDTGTGDPTTRRDDGVEDGTEWGTSPVGLTEIGEGVREISSGGEVVIHSRTTIPPGAPYGLNPGIFVGFVIEAGLSNPVGI